MRAQEHGYRASRELIYYHLQECAKRKDLLGGRRILSSMICNGLESISVLGDHLIRLFAACGNLMEANYVFYAINRPTIFTWNSIISAHVSNGEGERALVLYQKMQEVGSKPDKVTFLGVLKSCGSTGSICLGRMVHDQIIICDFDTDPSISNSLVDMYANCGSLFEAYSVFIRLVDHNVVSWTIMIAACAHCNYCMFALFLYDQMHQEGIKPNEFTFTATLKACISSQNIEQGKIIHDHIIRSGCTIDKDLGSTIVEMYVKCCNLQEVRKVFDDLPHRDVVSWGVMIAGYAQHDGSAAIKLYKSMQKEGLKPDKFIYSSVLKACACAKAIDLGSLIYKEVLQNGFQRDLIVGTALVCMYAECGDLETAQKTFDELMTTNEVSWSALIKGHVQQEHNLLALQLYEKMQCGGFRPCQTIHVFVLKACAHSRALMQGRLIHDQIVRSKFECDTVIGSSIIDFYAQSGYLADARLVFDKMQDRDTMALGVLFEGYLQHGQVNSVLVLFADMQSEGVKVDVFLCMCLLRACDCAHDLKVLHDQIIRNKFENDAVVGNTLIDMYANYASLKETHMVFQRVQNRDAASWTALMGAYASHGKFYAAFSVFEEMRHSGVQPTEVTYLCFLKTCTIAQDIPKGRLAHDEIIRSGLVHEVVVGNALVDMYTNCGHVDDAQNVFDGLRHQDEVSWGALIAGYSQHGFDVLALELFGKMQEKGLKQSKVIVLCMLKACSNLGAVVQGKLIHYLVMEDGLECDWLIISALVYMYAKCGCLKEAQKVFHTPQCQDVTLWGTLIGHCGNANLVRELFVDMQRQGIAPNTLLFTNIITACTHEGLLEEGQGHFKSLREAHGIAFSNILHYTSMADLLGRTGHLKEAYDFLHTMPMPPDVVVWRSLLSGCKLHEDVDLGRHCFDHVAGQAPAFAHMLMPCVHEAVHEWNAVNHMHKLRNCVIVHTEPQLVWKDVDNEICKFVDGEDSLCAEKGMLAKLDLVDWEKKCRKSLKQQPLNAEHQLTFNLTTQ